MISKSGYLFSLKSEGYIQSLDSKMFCYIKMFPVFYLLKRHTAVMLKSFVISSKIECKHI